MRKRILVTAGVLLCLLSGCRDSKPSDYETGVENLEKQNYTEAIENFQNAIQEGDHSMQSWRGIGISWTGQGIFDKAEEAFATALDLTEKSDKAMKTDLYLYLADAQYHQGNYQGCIDTCDELLGMKKEKDGYFLRGSAYLHLNKYKEADQNFGKVLSGSRDYEDYLDIFKVYTECDLNADGGEYLESALEITAKSPEDFYNRGRVYYYLSEYDSAVKELEKAQKKEYAEAAVYLGKVYVAAGDLENAEKMYKKCLETDSLKAQGYNGLAFCSMEKGDLEQALSYTEKGLKLKDPEVNQALLFNEIVIYEKSRDFASAKAKISEYLEQYPADEAAVRENYFLQTR